MRGRRGVIIIHAYARGKRGDTIYGGGGARVNPTQYHRYGFPYGSRVCRSAVVAVARRRYVARPDRAAGRSHDVCSCTIFRRVDINRRVIPYPLYTRTTDYATRRSALRAHPFPRVKPTPRRWIVHTAGTSRNPPVWPTRLFWSSRGVRDRRSSSEWISVRRRKRSFRPSTRFTGSRGWKSRCVAPRAYVTRYDPARPTTLRLCRRAPHTSTAGGEDRRFGFSRLTRTFCARTFPQKCCLGAAQRNSIKTTTTKLHRWRGRQTGWTFSETPKSRLAHILSPSRTYYAYQEFSKYVIIYSGFVATFV